MNFSEIQRQAAIAERKAKVVSMVSNGGDLLTGISVSYEICPDETETYYIEKHSDLYRKIRALIAEELTKDNMQTEENLKSWIGN